MVGFKTFIDVQTSALLNTLTLRMHFFLKYFCKSLCTLNAGSSFRLQTIKVWTKVSYHSLQIPPEVAPSPPEPLDLLPKIQKSIATCKSIVRLGFVVGKKNSLKYLFPSFLPSLQERKCINRHKAWGVMNIMKQNEMNEKLEEWQALAFPHHCRVSTFQSMVYG